MLLHYYIMYFLIKNLEVVVLNIKLCQTSIPRTKLKNYASQILENLENVKYTNLFKDIIWSADLVYMKLVSKFNVGIRFYFVFKRQ